MIHESKFVLQENEEHALQVVSNQNDFGRGNNKWKGRNLNDGKKENEWRNGLDHHTFDWQSKATNKS